MRRVTVARTRMHWMDALRGLAVALVALNHSLDFPNQFGLDFSFPGRNFMFGALEPYRVPLLLVLSGLLLRPSLRKPVFDYYWGKVARILWPLLVWGCITAAAIVHDVDLLNPEYWRSGPMHLWFLAVLLAVYLIGPLVRLVPAVMLALIGPALLLLFDPESMDVRKALFWSFFFFAGVAVEPFVQRVQQLGPWFGVVTAAAAVVFAYASTQGIIRVNPAWPLSVLASLPGLSFVLWLGPRLPRLRPLEFVGRRSIVLYCAHVPPMLLMARILANVPVQPELLLWVPIVIATFAVPLLMTWKYEWFKWAFELPVRRRSAAIPQRTA